MNKYTPGRLPTKSRADREQLLANYEKSAKRLLDSGYELVCAEMTGTGVDNCSTWMKGKHVAYIRVRIWNEITYGDDAVKAAIAKAEGAAVHV